MNEKPFRIGLISDTHGLLRPEALAALRDSDAIIHAGDIGDPAILERLAGIAPVTAVRGNNDRDAVFAAVPERACLVVGSVVVEVIHDLSEFDAGSQCHVVVSGHSHRPLVETRDEMLYINPGSAGPRRFRLPISVALLHVDGTNVDAELIDLVIAPTPR